MIRKIIPLIVFAIFGFYLMGANFQAKLGIIDDHEIAWLLGPDGRVSIREFVPTLLKTEVRQWGTYLRYRPSYYALRVAETALWKDKATLWYGTRYVIFVVSMLLMYWILSNYVPGIVAYAVIFYVFTMPFWPDLLTRLGPSEIYAVPASLIFAYGILKNRLWMVAIGYAVCVGAKENFLVLFPFLLAWIFCKWKAKKLQKRDWLVTLILTIYTTFIVTAILVATAKAGTDVYGTQISYRYRITKFIWDIPKIIADRHVLPVMITANRPER